jgi:hypothetical protein
LLKHYRLILMDTVPGLFNGDKTVHTGTVRRECPQNGSR